MVFDQHQVAGREAVAEAARGVCDDEFLDAEGLQHAHRKHDRGGGVAFVAVHASLHEQHGDAFDDAVDESAFVALDGRRWKVRDVAEGQGLTTLLEDCVGDSAKA